MASEFNEYSRLSRVAVRRPEAAFQSEARIAEEWRPLNYHAAPDLAQANAEYRAFEAVLKSVADDVVALPDAPGLGLDSLYVRDSLIVTPAGIVEAAMGKPARVNEPARNASLLKSAGFEVIGRIEPPGKIEGGDLVWIDRNTLLVGLGYRTNAASVDQLRAVTGGRFAIHTFDLPHYKGRSDVFHLMSVLSPVDRDLAVVYLPLMPVRLVEFLEERGIRFVEVPEDEFPTMGCNVLALAPRHVVLVEGNLETERRLRAAGCRVEAIKGAEICRKGEGGPTCLTRPLIRSA
ncbi:MAG: arginine deiminase family protein [Hyphomicrobiales bacterium]